MKVSNISVNGGVLKVGETMTITSVNNNEDVNGFMISNPKWLSLDAYKTMDFSGKKKNIIVYKPVVEVENGKIIRKWASIRKAAKDLYLTRQTVMNYCNNKTKKKQYNLMWEEDYRRNKHEDINE